MLNDGSKTFEISAAILAGGQSRRMGQDKSLLEIDGKPMISWVLEAIESAFTDIMIIGHDATRFNFLHVPVYSDVIESNGPLSGIYTALRKAQFQDTFVLACDQPFISKQLVYALCSAHKNTEITAIQSPSGPEPLCAVYSNSCIPQIELQLKAGHYQTSAIFNQVKVRLIDLEVLSPNPEVISNINTKDELDIALLNLEGNRRKTRA